MATAEEKRKNRALVWQPRIKAADDYYDEWAKKFAVKDLEEAYYGFQWDKFHENEEYKEYVLNLIFSSVDVKIPSLLFKSPVYIVDAKPAKLDFDPANATMRARLKEDTLNYFAQGGIKHFAEEIEACILDAFFRFGVLEVGYTADYVHNPDAGKPFLKSDREPTEIKKEGEVIRQPDFLIAEEQIYARRIPSKRFRVGGVDQSNLDRCSWYGYLDLIRKEDLLASSKVNDGYNKQVILDANAATPDSSNWMNENFKFSEPDWDKNNNYDVIPVWKIYDMRSKELLMFNYDVSDIIYTEQIDRPKHFVLKFRNMLEGFYPLPYTFNWISPQAEVNETREAARTHRRRFQRKYIARKGAFDETEKDKLQNGGDGTIAEADGDPMTSITIMPNANLGAQHDQALVISKDDFNTISGTSAEQRGQSDRTTATQSQIKERRSVIRESRDKEIVASWLSKIGKEILVTAKDELALPFWTKLTQDDPELFEEMNYVKGQYQLITSEAFGDEDFEVSIKLSSMSPVDQEEEKERMVEFLTIVTQFPQVAMSPTMIREIADRTGFRNERAIAEYVRMAQLMQTTQVAQLAQATGQDPAQLLVDTLFMRNADPEKRNPIAQRRVAQMTPPTTEQVNNQVTQQLTATEE